jgi:hypothetical protein
VLGFLVVLVDTVFDVEARLESSAGIALDKTSETCESASTTSAGQEKRAMSKKDAGLGKNG